MPLTTDDPLYAPAMERLVKKQSTETTVWGAAKAADGAAIDAASLAAEKAVESKLNTETAGEPSCYTRPKSPDVCFRLKCTVPTQQRRCCNCHWQWKKLARKERHQDSCGPCHWMAIGFKVLTAELSVDYTVSPACGAVCWA